jgi:restriction endonuclease S subunit
MKLKELVKLDAGINRSRIGDPIPLSYLYTATSVEEDLSQVDGTFDSPKLVGHVLTRTGDVIFGMANHRGAIVTAKNEGKCLTSNFAKARFDASIVDPWFLVYWFNESVEVKIQDQMNSGRALSTPSGILELEITLPPIQRQKAIGCVYKTLCRRLYLLEKEKAAWKRLALEEMNKTLNKGH